MLTRDLAVTVFVDLNRPDENRDVIDKIPGELDGCPINVKEEGRSKDPPLEKVVVPKPEHHPLQDGSGGF